MTTRDKRILSEERLQEIAEREAAATPGPWLFKPENGVAWANLCTDRFGDKSVCFFPDQWAPPSESDAAFIVEARSDVPDLLGMIRALQESNNSIPSDEQLDAIEEYYNQLVLNAHRRFVPSFDGTEHLLRKPLEDIKALIGMVRAYRDALARIERTCFWGDAHRATVTINEIARKSLGLWVDDRAKEENADASQADQRATE